MSYRDHISHDPLRTLDMLVLLRFSPGSSLLASKQTPLLVMPMNENSCP
jgi:hypothetical protein